jgi:hypothetical protein
MGSTVTIALADGRHFDGRAENGMLEAGELDDKFGRLTRSALGEPGASTLFERLQRLEDEKNLGGSALNRSDGWCPEHRDRDV